MRVERHRWLLAAIARDSHGVVGTRVLQPVRLHERAVGAARIFRGVRVERGGRVLSDRRAWRASGRAPAADHRRAPRHHRWNRRRRRCNRLHRARAKPRGSYMLVYAYSASATRAHRCIPATTLITRWFDAATTTIGAVVDDDRTVAWRRRVDAACRGVASRVGRSMRRCRCSVRYMLIV